MVLHSGLRKRKEKNIMKKSGFARRAVAMLLVLVMTLQLLPLGVLAWNFGQLKTADSGVDIDTLGDEDSINWPIKIYDYLSDGILFELNDSNVGGTDASQGTTIPTGSTEGYVAPYGGGYSPPVTAKGVDFTYGSSTAWSSSSGSSPYYHWNTNGYGKAYQLTKVDAVDYRTPMYAKLNSDIGSARNFMATNFGAATSTSGAARYMVLVYRALGLESDSQIFQVRASSDTGFSSWDDFTYSLPDSSDWRYEVIDLQSKLGSYTWVQYIWFAFYTTTSTSNANGNTGSR